jgi:hypothetical protein
MPFRPNRCIPKEKLVVRTWPFRLVERRARPKVLVETANPPSGVCDRVEGPMQIPRSKADLGTVLQTLHNVSFQQPQFLNDLLDGEGAYSGLTRSLGQFRTQQDHLEFVPNDAERDLGVVCHLIPRESAAKRSSKRATNGERAITPRSSRAPHFLSVIPITHLSDPTPKNQRGEPTPTAERPTPKA